MLAFRSGAQCDRVGWVASYTPGCGAKIIDLDNGELLKAVSGAENLSAGKTIRFSAKPASLPAGCIADGYQAVALSCVSDTLPCLAQFGYAVNQSNAFRLGFEAEVYDAAVQFCSWTFGDGASATGPTVQHTFPHEGYFPVCLTVTDAYGCSAERCRNVFVSDQNPNWCGYDIEVTAVGPKLFCKIMPVTSDAGILQSVKWFDSKTNKLLAETAEFSTLLPGEGVFYICAQYEVANLKDGSICTTTRCQSVVVATPSCANPGMVNPGAVCPSFFAPVCACNGITYMNECSAIAAGVSKWWAGECGLAPSGSCGTDLEAEIISGSPDAGYTVRFRNLSSGDYSVAQLDFGDGTPIWQGGPQDSICEHFYAQSGIYRANLTVWKQNNCVSSVTKILATNAFSATADNMPPATDYVLPGDANGDKKANVYDLLSIGLGYASSGAPRPFATTAWTPQFSPNWTKQTNAGVNFKHADCDGNGVINDFDRGAIEQNYTSINIPPVPPPAKVAPCVRVRFDKDTVTINPNNPAALEISADIIVGHSNNPVYGLYGLAFALQYPEFVNHDPEVFYGTGSFFGFPTDILLMPRDNYARRQLDMGFSRKYGQAVSGFGSIAKINFSTDFIIIIDIIERSGEKIIPLTIPIGGLQGIDAQGNALELNAAVQDTLWLKLEETTVTESSALEKQALLFPNPAADGATLLMTGTPVLEQIDVYNALGQIIRTIQPAGNRSVRIDTKTWANGLYTLQVRTSEGVLKKRLLVQH